MWAKICKVLSSETTITHKEIVLHENLKKIREAIARYTANKGAWPISLKDLVDQGYLDKIPPNPITGQDWCCITEDDAQITKGGTGIVNIRSDDSQSMPDRIRLYTNRSGKRYSEW